MIQRKFKIMGRTGECRISDAFAGFFTWLLFENISNQRNNSTGKFFMSYVFSSRKRYVTMKAEKHSCIHFVKCKIQKNRYFIDDSTNKLKSRLRRRRYKK